ncbi:MAG: cysteine--tRNA ligase [Thermoproteota archaeon]|nr:MAG: cysteine--tRNA ligase [Candidatus Korarchaeota archaeon]
MRVYNTLTGRVEEFKPLKSGEVRMYVCGPTTYDYSHIGHARAYICFDVMRRWLEYRGYRVKLIVNITDIDDKVVRRAAELGKDPIELSRYYEKAYMQDMDALYVKRADLYPRVTEHIPDIIKAVEKLIEKGYAYATPKGNVYFAVRKFKEYGKLSKQSIEDIVAGARVEPGEDKRSPEDFALWKAAKPGEPSWPSPWGPGRPGWHIECSVMSMKYLGETLDIHGGGQDLIFPHHENEIAQSEALTGKPFSRYWVHNGLVTVKGQEMSKSLKNFTTIREALARYDPRAIRLFALSAHYRSPLEFSFSKLDEASRSLERLIVAARLLREAYQRAEPCRSLEELAAREENSRELLAAVEDARRGFEEAMDSDFNTPEAIAAVFKLVKAVFKLASQKGGVSSYAALKALELLEDFSKVMGIPLEELKPAGEELSRVVESILELREEARREKNWKLADSIREALRKAGVEVEDTPEGPRWRVRAAHSPTPQAT